MQTTETATATSDHNAASAVNAKIIQAENNFRTIETFLMAARNFFANHADKLEGIEFRCWGWTGEIVFSLYGELRDPKAIARRFGVEGWKREADTHTCGRFDWTKTVDGVRLKIESAEQIKPQINEMVRL